VWLGVGTLYQSNFFMSNDTRRTALESAARILDRSENSDPTLGATVGADKEIRVWDIAVLPGDGIGSEVIAEGLKVLAVVESLLTRVKFKLAKRKSAAGKIFRGLRAGGCDSAGCDGSAERALAGR
jgi:hypothetical protein